MCGRDNYHTMTMTVDRQCLFRVVHELMLGDRTVRVTCESGKSFSKKTGKTIAVRCRRTTTSFVVVCVPCAARQGGWHSTTVGNRSYSYQGLKRPGQQLGVQLYYGASGDLI